MQSVFLFLLLVPSVLCDTLPPAFQYNNTGNGFTVSVNNTVLLQHTPDSPVLFIGGGSTSFPEKRGNFFIQDYTTERHGLSNFTQMQNSTATVITFREFPNNDDISVTVSLTTTSDHPLKVTFTTGLPAGFDRVWLRVKAEMNELVYGGGEQYSSLNLRGRTYPIWTREQGVGRNKSGDLLTFMVSKYEPGAEGDYHTTYYPQATFLSSRHYYCHVDSSNYAILDFSHKTFHELEMWAHPGPVLFNIDDKMIGLVQKLSTYLGTPPPLPDWMYTGAILGVQGGSAKMMEYYRMANSSGMPLSGLWIQDWAGNISTTFGKRLFWNWILDQKLYYGLKYQAKELKDKGVRVLGYINPHLIQQGSLFKVGDKNGYFIKNITGQTYVQNFGEFFCGTVDLTNPAAFKWYKEEVIIKNMINSAGLSGWMADFAEYTPVDAVFNNGMSGQEVHNLWPVLWAKLNREAVEEAGRLGDVVFWMRAGGARVSSYSTLMWAGDQNVDFSYGDGIPSTIPAALNMGLSGMGLTHYDVGGYTTLAQLHLTRTKELLLRSAEAAIFTPVFRSHEGNQPTNAWQFYSDITTLRQYTRLAQLYTLMAPYTKSIVQETNLTGIPVQRPMFFYHEDDPRTWTMAYQYFYGADVLVAPVYVANASQWSLYLPKGDWVYIWNTTKYTGPLDITVSAVVGYPPAFYRADSKWKATFDKLKTVPFVPNPKPLPPTSGSSFALPLNMKSILLMIFTVLCSIGLRTGA